MCIISSYGAWPCFLLYSFLLHSFILSPLQYWLMNPLQAKSLTSPYFLKKPHVVSFSHSWSIYHSLFHSATHIYKPNSSTFNTAYQDNFHMIRYNVKNVNKLPFNNLNSNFLQEYPLSFHKLLSISLILLLLI